MSKKERTGFRDAYSTRVAQFYERFDRTCIGRRPIGRMNEAITRRLYQVLLRRGDVSVDVGANHGVHTIPMGRAVAPNGTVFAFEPIPMLRERLKRLVEGEGLADVVKISDHALSRTSGTAEFVVVNKDLGLSGLRKKPRYPFEDPGLEKIEVEVSTLDRDLTGQQGIAFIKVDVEGGELHVLEGARAILGEQRPVVVFECSKHNAAKSYGYSREEFYDFFDGIDYELRDTMGCRSTPEHWERIGPWNLIASPREQGAMVADAVSVAVASSVIELELTE